MEIEWPDLYRLESSRFTLSPKLFSAWLQFLLFSRDDQPAVIDLESEKINEIAAEMQNQIKGGKNSGKKC